MVSHYNSGKNTKINTFYQDRQLSFYTLPILEFFWPKHHGYNKYI